MTDYIREAVGLADGFEWPTEMYATREFGPIERPVLVVGQRFLDALAAQLVRQVCAIPKYDVIISKDGTEIFSGGHVKGVEYDIETLSMVRSDDITMNTIRAIVDSGVLS